jgi:hypothetical protein
LNRVEEFVRRSLGLAGVAGLALLAGSFAFYMGGVRPAAEEALALREQLARAAPPRGPARPADAEEAFARFYGYFGAPAEALEALGAVFEAAAREGVSLDSGEYRLSRERGSRLHRYQIVLPAKGSYRAVRRFVARALNEVPGLALDDLALRRETVASAVVEARVQLTLYLRDAK